MDSVGVAIVLKSLVTDSPFTGDQTKEFAQLLPADRFTLLPTNMVVSLLIISPGNRYLLLASNREIGLSYILNSSITPVNLSSFTARHGLLDIPNNAFFPIDNPFGATVVLTN